MPVIPVAVRRHRRRRAARQEVRQVHPAGRPLRQAAGLLPLRGHGERPLHPALDHRRDHVRDHAALRPGVRRHVRHPRQGGGARPSARRRAAAEAREIDEELRGRRRRPDRRARIAGEALPGRRLVPRAPAADGWFAPAMAVEDRMFRGLAVLRVIVLVNAVALNVYRSTTSSGRSPPCGLRGVMVAWTAFAIWAYLEPARRRPALLARGPRGGRGADRDVAGGQGGRLQRHDPRLLGDGRPCSRGRCTGAGSAGWSRASC